MKLSIWQQFSSNHSANFTTVGQFESEEWAREAFKEIQDIIQNIVWWHEHIQEDENAVAAFNKILKDPVEAGSIPKLFTQSEFIHFLANHNPKHPRTVAEAFYQQQYNVSEWRKPLDWVHENSMVKDVKIFHDLVMISPIGSTWAGFEPFHSIMNKLGAKVSSSQEDGPDIRINIRCDAPSAETARLLVEKMKAPNGAEDWVWIRIEGFGDSRKVKETKLSATGQEIELVHFRPVGLTATRKDLSELDNLRALILYFQAEGCTNIEYSFSSI